MIPEAHILSVELNEVLVLDVCDEHYDANFVAASWMWYAAHLSS